MPKHWTYEEVSEGDDLQQGDILLPTDELTKLFTDVHPHFRDPKYVGYIVLTQSCDLVMRRKGCSAHYINVGVIRQLDSLITSLLDTVCSTVANGVYLDESKLDAKKLVSRIVNQNEQTLGLFYLHADADVGLGLPCVALLRVGVAFRSDHYQTIAAARTGRLTPEFRNKLGWLIGNIYSRIGTPDWADHPGGEKSVEEFTDKLLAERCRWVAREAKEAAERAGVRVGELDPEALVSTLLQHAPLSPKEEALLCVGRILKQLFPPESSDMITKAVNRLGNDSQFVQVFKRAKRM